MEQQENNPSNEQPKKIDQEKLENQEGQDSDVEFSSKDDERINGSNFTHSGNQVGQAGTADNDRDIISQ